MSHPYSVYIFICNNNWNSPDVKFFSTKEKAQRALLDKKKELQHRPGVDVIEDSPTAFVFLLGWEEHRVSWHIIEKPLE